MGNVIRMAVAAVALLACACAGPKEGKGPLVLAAASLQDALTEAADDWSAQGHPKPVLSFASTSALARQVEAGAPADLFVSADEEWMDTLEKDARIKPQTRMTFLTNRLVLVAPAQSDASISIAPGFELARLLGAGKLAVADPAAVPAGRYARQALEKLGVWADVQSRIVPAENVRVALALVARGEAALGIVYASDAKSEPGVRVVDAFPESSHEPIRYPLAILAASENPDSEAFRTYLLSGEAAAIFRKYGFGTPAP
ncbi:MAG: molybdate ABC transporter substrate-binding protein [Novosphingobium sp.]|nr:molybdate ABC transporter substrate-binding protein [Novosphingobium sp.]